MLVAGQDHSSASRFAEWAKQFGEIFSVGPILGSMNYVLTIEVGKTPQ